MRTTGKQTVFPAGGMAGGIVCAALLCMALQAGAATRVPFSRYEVIVASQPFGRVPDPPQPDPSQIPAQPPEPAVPPFVEDLRMCAVTENSLGVRVGFVNIKSKPMQSYFLYVGESTEDGTGITVMDADFEQERALLRKDEREYWIYMTEAPEVARSQGERSSGQSALARLKEAARKQQASGARTTSGGRRLSYAERLRARREALRKLREEVEAKPPPAPPPKLDRESLEAHLKEYQMDLIRKGAPPLPIPLTKDMDDQLVAEGVLPPQPPGAE